jgi:multiple antibiotic resistance protein
MLDATKSLLLILSAIFPIVDPIGGSPFFLALTADYGSEARRALSWRIAADSFVLLAGSYFVGTCILAFFGISLPVVEVGGGMILVAMGWTTLMENEEACDKGARTRIEPQDVFGRAFYPLTLPLTVGPGSISVAITLGANAARHHALHLLTISTALVGFALIALSIFLCYGFADRLSRTLGRTATLVITKLSAFLLVCIGVQIAWNGIKELLESVTLHLT